MLITPGTAHLSVRQKLIMTCLKKKINLADDETNLCLRLKSDSFNNWLCWMWSFIHQCVSELGSVVRWSSLSRTVTHTCWCSAPDAPPAGQLLRSETGHRCWSTCGEGLRDRRRRQIRDTQHLLLTHSQYCVFKSSWIIHADPFRTPWCHHRLSRRTRLVFST